jgi:MerR family transcriptional regulator/heat shock protein HspR
MPVPADARGGLASDDPAFSIGQVADRLGVSAQVLRLYEQRGLILVRKGAGGQRQYSESDVQRFKCIRTAITEHKISIEGIRRMQSLVPCWEHVRCPVGQRSRCPAYTTPTAGCWTHLDRDDVCRAADCRQCDVYRLSSDCDTIKSLIHHIPAPSPHRHHPRHKDNQA